MARQRISFVMGRLFTFSGGAFLVGVLAFCLSLTPSLLPRPNVLQGLLSGIVFAVGYGLSRLVAELWSWLGVPSINTESNSRIRLFCVLAGCLLAALTLARVPHWQNSIRAVMDLPPVEVTGPLIVVGTAATVAAVLILSTRLLLLVAGQAVNIAKRVLPPRIATVVGICIFGFGLLSFVDGFILRKALIAMDTSFALLDRTTDDATVQPASPTSSGSPASNIAWDGIGRTGKNFLASGTTAAEIASFQKRPAKEPIRIYAGYNSAGTVEQRAELALSDLIRAGGFERSTLVVTTVTGTGWVDPAAIEPLAYITGGDVAIVTLQYSYLPSWLTLIVDPDRSRDAARTLFDAVYGHWTTLPLSDRPKLYLFGLSLGALGSETSVDLITLFDDPIDGALWAGPPFASTIWPHVVAGRDAGTPEWRPVFRNGRMIRFMTQDGYGRSFEEPWGRMRILYLQHPSDPMSFFSPKLAFTRPDWLINRGPDISPDFNWYPLVTFFQVLFDIPLATSVPPGRGHVFAAEDYIDAWVEVLALPSWTPERTRALKAIFKGKTSAPL